MVKVTALSSFEHHGSRTRGTVFEVSPQHASLLEARGLVKTNATAAATATEPAGKTLTGAPSGAELIRQKPDKVIAAVAGVTDRATLEEARAAESAKGAKAREAVIAAIDAALAAAPASQE